jgi:hypothetical protein
MKGGKPALRPLADLNEQGVAQDTAASIWNALERLLYGRINLTQTDGRLTVTNLAVEAGVSRATVNRATSLVRELRRQTELMDQGLVIAQNPVERVRQLERDLVQVRKEKTAEGDALRGSLTALANHVQVLSRLLGRDRLASEFPGPRIHSSD